jgi:hypothetical protein
MRWIHVTGFVACLALGACDLVGPGGAEVESVRVIASGPLVRKLQVSLSRPGPVSVTYESARSQPPLVESGHGLGEHEVLLTRLLPGTTYRYTIRAGGGAWSDSLVSGPLAPDVEAILIEGSTGLDDGLILYEVNEPRGFAGALIADNLGRIVW